MDFPCLVKIENTGEHAIMIDDKSVLVLEGNDAGKVLEYDDENITKPVVFRFQTINEDDFEVIKPAYENMLKRFNLERSDTYRSDECLRLNFSIADTVHNHHPQVTIKSPEPQLEWHTEHEVKNSFNQFVPVDVVFEDEKRIWFRYRPAGQTTMQQPATPAAVYDVHSENLCSIAKSSEHYRVIKKADVTMSECLTQIVADGPVKATLIITE